MDKRALGYKFAAECARARCRRVRASRATRARISIQQGTWAADLEICTLPRPELAGGPAGAGGRLSHWHFTLLIMIARSQEMSKNSHQIKKGKFTCTLIYPRGKTHSQVSWRHIVGGAKLNRQSQVNSYLGTGDRCVGRCTVLGGGGPMSPCHP